MAEIIFRISEIEKEIFMSKYKGSASHMLRDFIIMCNRQGLKTQVNLKDLELDLKKQEILKLKLDQELLIKKEQFKRIQEQQEKEIELEEIKRVALIKKKEELNSIEELKNTPLIMKEILLFNSVNDLGKPEMLEWQKGLYNNRFFTDLTNEQFQVKLDLFFSTIKKKVM